MEKMLLRALRSWACVNMGIHQEAEKKYRADSKPEAAAMSQGKYEAFYQIATMLKMEDGE